MLDSADTPGGCWAHFSVIEMSGIKHLLPGQRVQFDFIEVAHGENGFQAERVQILR